MRWNGWTLFWCLYPRAQTPTWIRSGGEEAETNGFWDPKFGRNASFKFSGSGLRSARSHWTPSSSLSVFCGLRRPHAVRGWF